MVGEAVMNDIELAASRLANHACTFAILHDMNPQETAKQLKALLATHKAEFTPAQQIVMEQVVDRVVAMITGRAS
jgi:hypothetical protein